MPFTPADSQIFAPLFGDPELAAIFADEQYARRMLEVEAALARAQGRLGVIPQGAAEAISSAAGALGVDLERLRAGVGQDGFPIIELVRQLRYAVAGSSSGAGSGEEGGRAAADFVHYGATTQDIMDTAFVLQARAALAVIEGQLRRLIAGLCALAERHRATLMAGRTHSQQALPLTFGYKAAGWLAPLPRHLTRLEELKPRLLVVQFGGAAGTLAALGERGLAVQAALAEELALAEPPMPWHTQRDALAELAGWLSLVSGGLAKMAQDIILMAQSEVGELRESGDPQRGGSSAMPQKSNPITSELILAAARANANHLAAMHHALVHEHERGTHAWQLEWLTLPQMFALTAAALRHAVWLSENLQVDRERMLANLRASHGLVLAEALTAALARHVGQERAKKLVTQAARAAQTEGRDLFEVARGMADVPLDWETLRKEEHYLGAAESFIDRVLAEAREFLEK